MNYPFRTELSVVPVYGPHATPQPNIPSGLAGFKVDSDSMVSLHSTLDVSQHLPEGTTPQELQWWQIADARLDLRVATAKQQETDFCVLPAWPALRAACYVIAFQTIVGSGPYLQAKNELAAYQQTSLRQPAAPDMSALPWWALKRRRELMEAYAQVSADVETQRAALQQEALCRDSLVDRARLAAGLILLRTTKA